MRRHTCDPLAVPRREIPLLQALEADRAQLRHCQQGEHDMLATPTPGVAACRVCRTLGVCLLCGLSLPYGACIVVCPKHIGFVRWQAARQTPRITTAVRPHTGERREP